MVPCFGLVYQCKVKILIPNLVSVGIKVYLTPGVFQMLQRVFCAIIHAYIMQLKLTRNRCHYDLWGEWGLDGDC